MNSKQRGIIDIPYEIVRANPQYVFDIFQKIGFLPVDTHFSVITEVIRYTGYSSRFPENQYSTMPRYYGIMVTTREPGVVQDADVTFNCESDLGQWRLPKEPQPQEVIDLPSPDAIAEALAFESGEPF